MHTPFEEVPTFNPHAVGMVMKEIVRRAIEEIKQRQFDFEFEAKMGYSGEMDDFVTSADKAAQATMVKSLRECFPGFGIVAEEAGLREPCTIEGHEIYFTVDPLDGTRAFKRKQSTGVGTMLALVCDGEVVATFIGDVMSHEIYGYRPRSDRAFRISQLKVYQELVPDTSVPLEQGYILLREDPRKYDCPRPGHLGVWTSMLLSRQGDSRLFKGVDMANGSIGISMARLWKGEVAACLLDAGVGQPWDMVPVIGMCRKLGFVFGTVDETGFQEASVLPSPEPIQQGEWLVVHRQHVPAITAWAREIGPITIVDRT